MELNELVPSEFYLGQNYPNPFKDKALIKYCVAYKTHIQLTVYDSEGEVIEKLVDEEKKPGTYEIEFDAAELQEGVYSYFLDAGEYSNLKKMNIEKKEN